MTTRDRLVMIAVACLAIAGLAWIMVVSPERKKAHEAAAEVASAQSKLSAARSQLGSARTAQIKSAKSYATIAGLGKAVPTAKEVPALIYELSQASKAQSVVLTSISSSSSGSSGSSSSAAAATASAAGFTQVPFTFVFSGSYFELERMLHRLTSMSTRTANGSLVVNGRLITIQSVQLATQASSQTGPLTATVAATVYALPPEQAASAAGSAATPAAAGGGAAGRGSSPAPAPATIKANP